MKKTKTLALGAAVAALTLSACGSAATGEQSSSDSGAAEAVGTVTIGMFNWDEDIAVSHLWKNILESKGYDVRLESADPGPVFQGMADGDYDVVLDV